MHKASESIADRVEQKMGAYTAGQGDVADAIKESMYSKFFTYVHLGGGVKNVPVIAHLTGEKWTARDMKFLERIVKTVERTAGIFDIVQAKSEYSSENERGKTSAADLKVVQALKALTMEKSSEWGLTRDISSPKWQRPIQLRSQSFSS